MRNWHWTCRSSGSPRSLYELLFKLLYIFLFLDFRVWLGIGLLMQLKSVFLRTLIFLILCIYEKLALNLSKQWFAKVLSFLPASFDLLFWLIVSRIDCLFFLCFANFLDAALSSVSPVIGYILAFFWAAALASPSLVLVLLDWRDPFSLSEGWALDLTISNDYCFTS